MQICCLPAQPHQSATRCLEPKLDRERGSALFVWNRPDKLSEESKHFFVTLEFSRMRGLFIFNQILPVPAGAPTKSKPSLLSLLRHTLTSSKDWSFPYSRLEAMSEAFPNSSPKIPNLQNVLSKLLLTQAKAWKLIACSYGRADLPVGVIYHLQ